MHIILIIKKQRFEFNMITSEEQLISGRLNNMVPQLSGDQTGIGIRSPPEN